MRCSFHDALIPWLALVIACGGQVAPPVAEPLANTVTDEEVSDVAEDGDQACKISGNKLAMVILIQGNGNWMGNETYFEDDTYTEFSVEGAFTGLPDALDVLAKAGAPGSLATVLVYSNGKAEVKLPMRDIARLNGSVLGSQKDFYENIDFPLIVALTAVISAFDAHGDDRRKVLVVIGDGTGEFEDISRPLADAIEQLKQRQVDSFTMFYDNMNRGDPTGQTNMAQLGYTANHIAASRNNFATYAQSFVDAINAPCPE